MASSGASLARAESARKGAHEVAVSLGAAMDSEEGDKYARRVSVHARVIQHVTQALPAWASAALAPADGAPAQPLRAGGGTPAGRRLSVSGGDDLGEPSGRRRGRKRTLWQRLRDPRAALLLIAIMCACHALNACCWTELTRCYMPLFVARSTMGTMVLLYGRATPMRTQRR